MRILYVLGLPFALQEREPWMARLWIHRVSGLAASGWWRFSLTRVLKTFFDPDGWNIQAVGVRCLAGAESFLVRAEFACIVADEKAIKETLSVKGASGKTMLLPKCCWQGVCRDVAARWLLGARHVRRQGTLRSTHQRKFQGHGVRLERARKGRRLQKGTR